MDETAKAPQCPKCGAPLAPDAPEGLCPRCLMELNLKTQTEVGGEVGPEGTKVVATGEKTVPPVEEIARHFPQLEILECLGRGGMGVVYKARQPKLNRLVALKILAKEREKDPRFAERFLREAQALARLSHPNIVAVHDFGEADGLFFLLMEYVDGMNLREVLRAGKMAPDQALAIVPRICEALQYAHEQGIVHRDIKPENILLDKQGRVKIADFGIAKILGTEQKEEKLTAEQQSIGTPHYMAPEQVEKPSTVDHRADIYSLGVVFYEMLTGELPLGKFAAPSRKVQVDVRLDEVVLHALEKEPDRRYQHASQVKNDVETIATTPPVGGAGGGANALPPLRPRGGPAPQPEPLPQHIEPRFSKLAIVGAAWAPFFLIYFLWWISYDAVAVPNGARPTELAWFKVLALVVMFPLAFTAPFGSTILGCISISQIRRSAGRLYGAGLAVFDALLFPLLLLDGFVVGLICWVGSHLQFGDMRASFIFLLLLIVVGAVVVLGLLLLNFFIIRGVWRMAHRPPGGAAPEQPQNGLAVVGYLALGVLAVMVLGVVVGLPVLFYLKVVSRQSVAVQSAAAQAQQALRATQVAIEYSRSQEFMAAPLSRGDLDQLVTIAGKLEAVTNGANGWQITSHVPEADIVSVMTGQSIRFELEAMPGRSFEGVVKQVSNKPAALASQVVYETKMEVTGDDTGFRQGMTANVSIIAAHRENVLKLPNAALKFKPLRAAASTDPRSRRPVHILRASQPGILVRRFVTTGISDGVYTEVLSGLAEGDMVVTGTRNGEPANGLVIAESSDAMASQPETNTAARDAELEILRVRIRQAEQEIAQKDALLRNGVINQGEVQSAKDELEVLKAQLAGDEVGVARVRLAAAQHQFEVLDAQHKVGLVGATEYQAARNLLEVWQAELNAAVARGPSTAMSEREKEIARSNLNSRVKIAMQIMSLNDRDTALGKVARDAAAAGEGAIARSAVIGIVNMNARDSVASEVSRALTQSGQFSSALDIATTMMGLNSRDPALAAIARGAADHKDADVAKKAVMRIMSLNTRDETAREIALHLAGAGLRTEAQEIARLIVSMNLRDQTFSELAK